VLDLELGSGVNRVDVPGGGRYVGWRLCCLQLPSLRSWVKPPVIQMIVITTMIQTKLTLWISTLVPSGISFLSLVIQVSRALS